jgi:hypothetical protein
LLLKNASGFGHICIYHHSCQPDDDNEKEWGDTDNDEDVNLHLITTMSYSFWFLKGSVISKKEN